LLPSFKLYFLKLEITATITLVNQLFLGGQHTPFLGGQYAPFLGGHFNPFLGGQHERFFHFKRKNTKPVTKSSFCIM
jgi:hypothetical protein